MYVAVFPSPLFYLFLENFVYTPHVLSIFTPLPIQHLLDPPITPTQLDISLSLSLSVLLLLLFYFL